MPYFIECGNCAFWKYKEFVSKGTCDNEKSGRYNEDTFDTENCDLFELKEE